MEWPRRGPARGWWALTGTPGTGKSTVLRHLPPDALPIELADLARAFGGRDLGGRSVEVDVPAVARYVRSTHPKLPVIVGGHLAHRLPIERVLVLRCHPVELARRLERRDDEDPSHRAQNVAAEAIDLIAIEARARRVPVAEVNTTGRGPREIARVVRAVVRGAPPPPFEADWLADPAVPAMLTGTT